MTEVVKLKYGHDELDLLTPDKSGCRTVSVEKKLAALTDKNVERVLDNPENRDKFVNLFSPGDSVTIIVSDITRYTAAEIFLPVMIARLNSAGVQDNAITILFANGTHRKQTDEEKAALVGADIFRRIECVDHDANNSSFSFCGYSFDGAEVRINRLAMECDKLVITGVIAFHYLAGFGGGRKAVMPGVASFEDIQRYHYLSMNPDGAGRRPGVDTGKLDGNPMHEVATAVMNKVNPVFLLNTVLDSDGKAVEVVAGAPLAAFNRGCKITRNISEAPIETLADVVVASCGGYPKDINFIQSHKAYDNAVRALKPAGKLFLAAKCEDGIGSDTFLPWFRHGGGAEIDMALRGEAFRVNGQTALATAIKSETFETVLLSDMDRDSVTVMGLRPVASEKDFLAEASNALHEAVTSLVIPEGGYVFPVVVK